MEESLEVLICLFLFLMTYIHTSSFILLLKKSYTDSSVLSCFPLTKGSLSIVGNNGFENNDCFLIMEITPDGS